MILIALGLIIVCVLATIAVGLSVIIGALGEREPESTATIDAKDQHERLQRKR